VVAGSTGQLKAHPLIGEIREHRKLAESLARALALPLEGETVGRIRSPSAKAAANVRWRRSGIAAAPRGGGFVVSSLRVVDPRDGWDWWGWRLAVVRAMTTRESVGKEAD
jgi:hypothetical protein